MPLGGVFRFACCQCSSRFQAESSDAVYLFDGGTSLFIRSVLQAGLAYGTPEQVMSQRERIQQVVASGYTPLGNMAGMTDEERDTIAAWRE